jgi:hypothetical protein
MWWLKFLDIFFLAFHTAFLLFNLFGWIFRRLRKWNLITLMITAFSWFALGYFYGFGYCFLTDWHWSVREKLGDPIPYNSYVQFLLADLLHIQVSADVADWLTGGGFASAVIISVLLNIRDRRLR